MKKLILMTMAALVVGSTVGFAQIRMGQRNGGGPGGRGGGMGVDKSKDSVLTALKEETLAKFQQFTYEDAETGKTLTYNLCFPKDYDASKQYPMLMFIGDASTVGDAQRPLTQGYGALEFASDRDQTVHPSFVLVPSYTGVCVDDDFNTSDEVEMTIRLIRHLCQQYPIDQRRLYTTGQSMGGMMSFYFNIAHPCFFAASLFVGSQWDTSKMASFVGNKFFYIVGGGDTKASKGMADLANVLKENNARMDSASWSAKLPQEEQEQRVRQMLTSGNNIHLISFTPGSVLAEEGKGMEHMESFDYAYKLQTVRDWLFEQTLDDRTPSLLQTLRDVNSTDVLVSADAGDWHGSVKNSVHAVLKAAEKGATIVRIHLKRSDEGQVLADTDDASLQQTLTDILSTAKGKILVEIANPQEFIDEIKAAARQTGTEDIVILGGTMQDADLLFIPTINLDEKNALKSLKTALANNPVAVSLQFRQDNNKLLPKALQLLKGKTRIAFNVSDAGGRDDSGRGFDQEQTWGELIRMGGTIIGSNNIKVLFKYLQQQNR